MKYSTTTMHMHLNIYSSKRLTFDSPKLLMFILKPAVFKWHVNVYGIRIFYVEIKWAVEYT